MSAIVIHPAGFIAASGRVFRGQQAIHDEDMRILIDWCACLVELVVVGGALLLLLVLA